VIEGTIIYFFIQVYIVVFLSVAGECFAAHLLLQLCTKTKKTGYENVKIIFLDFEMKKLQSLVF